MSLRLTALITSLALAGTFATTMAYAVDEAGKPTKSSMAPAGEGPGSQGSSPSRSSDKSRAAVKADTKADVKSGNMVPAGQATAPAGMTTTNQDADKSMAPKTSNKSRADVKAETKGERAAGTLQPAGEAPQPSAMAPKK